MPALTLKQERERRWQQERSKLLGEIKEAYHKMTFHEEMANHFSEGSKMRSNHLGYRHEYDMQAIKLANVFADRFPSEQDIADFQSMREEAERQGKKEADKLKESIRKEDFPERKVDRGERGGPRGRGEPRKPKGPERGNGGIKPRADLETENNPVVLASAETSVVDAHAAVPGNTPATPSKPLANRTV